MIWMTRISGPTTIVEIRLRSAALPLHCAESHLTPLSGSGAKCTSRCLPTRRSTKIAEILHRQFETGARLSSNVALSAIVTRPCLLELQLEQPMHGYVPYRRALAAIWVPAKQCQLSAGTSRLVGPMGVDSTSVIGNRLEVGTYLTLSIRWLLVNRSMP